jgi:hypothetical protein
MSGRTSPVPPSSVPGGAGTLSLKVQAARRDARRMPTALLCRRRCVEGGSCPEVLHGRVNSTRLDPPTHKIGSAHWIRASADQRARPGLRNGRLRVACPGRDQSLSGGLSSGLHGSVPPVNGRITSSRFCPGHPSPRAFDIQWSWLVSMISHTDQYSAGPDLQGLA